MKLYSKLNSVSNSALLLGIIIAVLLLVYWGYNRVARVDGSAYEGAGSIQVKDGTLFRSPSVEIAFDEFDLSKPFQSSYTFRNLPTGKYFLGVKVSTSEAHLEEILRGNIKLRVVHEDGASFPNCRIELESCRYEVSYDTEYQYFLYDPACTIMGSQVPDGQTRNLYVDYEPDQVEKPILGQVIIRMSGGY